MAASSCLQCSSSRVTIVSSTSVAVTGRSMPSRWCSTEMSCLAPRRRVTSSLISSPGRSGSLRPHHQIAARDGQSVTHDRDEHGRVDVAAGEDRHRGARPTVLAGQQRRDADRPGSLDHELRALEQQHDRLADLLVRHRDDVVEQILEQRHRELARHLHRDPVGDRVAVDACPARRRCAPPAGARATRSRCRAPARRRRSGSAPSRRPAPDRAARARSFPAPRRRAGPRTDG